MIELDHLFVTVPPEAPDLAQILSIGLREGSRNIHPGQGTACRRIFFHNTMLEFLWLTSAEEARSEAIRGTHLWERCTMRDAHICPFGICFRPATSAPDGLPCETWDYTPPYLPPDVTIPVATNASRLDEPMIFYLPFGKRPDHYPDDRRQPIAHPAGLRAITGVTLHTPAQQPASEALHALMATGLLSVQPAERYHLDIVFDSGQQGHRQDCAPTFPLTLNW